MLTKGLRLPAVLRDEPQYRLLFGSQVLSILGDRVTSVALPFAVLATGGGVGDVALVSAAQFLPFVVLALPAGVWADRLDRKRILIVSDLVRLVCQLVAASAAGRGASVPALVTIAAVYGAADAFFAPAFTGLLPATVSPVNLQPANALRGLAFSLANIGGPIVAGLLIAYAGGPGGALLFDAVTFVVSIGLLLPLRPRVVEEVLHGGPDRDDALPSGPACARAGARSRSWLVAFLAGMSVYHVVVLPSIFVIGPVLMQQELDGARSWAVIVACFGWATYSATCCSCGGARGSRPGGEPAAGGGVLPAAMIGSGLGTWGIGALELLAGVCVTGAFTLWETCLGEHVPGRSLSRVSSYDYLATAGVIPLGNLIAAPRARRTGCTPRCWP